MFTIMARVIKDNKDIPVMLFRVSHFESRENNSLYIELYEALNENESFPDAKWENEFRDCFMFEFDTVLIQLD